MTYDEIKTNFSKNDMIKSLKDGVVRKYSGYLTLCGTGYDSLNEDLVVYDNGKLATVVEKGIDHEAIAWDAHVTNVLSTCQRLGCSSSDLLKKDYRKELGYH